MKKLAFPLLAAAMTAAVVLSSPASAQDEQQRMHKNMPSFAAFDLDGDGAVSSEEFYAFRAERIAKHAEEGRKMKNLANAPAFEDIDTDGDGVISPEEFAAHQADRMQQAG